MGSPSESGTVARSVIMQPMSRLKRSILIFAALLIAAAAPAQARFLYVGEAVLIPGEVSDAQGLVNALDEVLVRLTGMEESSPTERLGLRVADARSLLQSQQRVRVELIDEDGNPVEELRLRAEFDPPSVDALLAREQLPRLGRERPAILLWAATDDELGARLVDDALFEQALREQGRRFGLDLIQPLGDATDMAWVQLSDIRGGFIDSIEPSADRYGAGVVALADLRQGEDDWSGRWIWRIDGLDLATEVRGETLAELVEPGLRALLSSLVDRFATVTRPDGGNIRRVVVDGIVEPIQYAEVLRFFDGLSLVQDIRVIEARSRSIRLELNLSGDGLEDMIRIGRTLAIDGIEPDGSLKLRLVR